MAMTEQGNSTSRYLLGKDSTGGYVIVMEDCYHAHFGTCVFDVGDDGISDGDGFPLKYDNTFVEIDSEAYDHPVAKFRELGKKLFEIGHDNSTSFGTDAHAGDCFFCDGYFVRILNVTVDGCVVSCFYYDGYDLNVDTSPTNLDSLDFTIAELKTDGFLIGCEVFDMALDEAKKGIAQIRAYINQQYNQNKNMKTIVYLHGYGSSSQSGTIAYLAKKMPECLVIVPDIPVDPKEALPFLHEYCKANDADLVIGTSMGGKYALQLTDYPRICVNPALYMSRLTDILKVGTFDYFQPTADGRSQYTITEDTIRHFQEMEQHLFDGVTPENQATCWGFFADGDALVNCKSDFAEHFNHVEDFHGEHRMNNNVMRDVIIPAVKKILEFQ